MSSTKHYRTCPLCEGMCGVEMTVEGNSVVSSRPDFENVWSRGHICPKGTALYDLHSDPDRIRMPMVRDGNTWREASWDEAFERCEHLLERVLSTHGRGALAVYLGNMIAKCFGLSRYVGYFLETAAIQSIYSSSTVDQQPRNLVSQLLYGHMWRIPIPDIDSTDLLVMFGANPSASKGSIFSHRNVMGAIKALQQRGGHLIVVDPCKTGTAYKADQWVPVRPGSDAALLLGIVHTLFAEDLVKPGHLAKWLNGLGDVQLLAERFPPERVQDFCGVDASAIRHLARQIANAPRAAVYGRIGLCTQAFGTLATWLIDVVGVLTGNLDRPGGSMWSKQAASHLDLSPGYPANAPVISGRTRVRGAPVVLGQHPAACFGEELDTPGEGQIKGLITVASNPALSAPASARIDAGLQELECMISVDVYLNETTRHANVILPTRSVLEQPHWDIYAWPFALQSGGHYSPPLFDKAEDWVEDWEVLLRLGALCAGQKNSEIDIDAFDDSFFRSICEHTGIAPDTAMAASPERGPERILDMAIRIGPYGDRYGEAPEGLTLDSFKEAPHGLLLGEAEPCVEKILNTPSGKIELAPDHILQDIPRLEQVLLEPQPQTVLIGRRHLASMNSSLHNVEMLAKGKNRCTLLIHPDDAARLDLAQGDKVKVESTENALVVEAEITADISPGVVSLPHGWGHDAKDTQLSVASRRPGVNSNLLSPHSAIDEASGTAVLNGIPVFLERV